MALKRTVISLEHVYIFILLTLVVVLFTYINIMRHHTHAPSSSHESKIIIKEQPHQHMFNLGTRPSIEDVLLDPHRAPLRDDRYFPNVNVEDLIVTGQEDLNQITVTLKYSIINTNITDTLEIQL